jgi:hypothetical protein
MTVSSKKSRNELSKEAFGTVVAALERDMPLVMHSSGDVLPQAVNPASVRLLSELTANYIAELVHAAVDSHELLNGGPQPLPPPPLPRPRQTVTPRPYHEQGDDHHPHHHSTDDGTGTGSNKQRKRRRRMTDEFWDEPLPEPKIKNKPTKATEIQGPTFEGVPVDEWVGVSGVDFFESSRARNAHVSLPTAIGTQSFIFPVCHDVGLYGKVLEVQAARRNIAPLLADPVIQDVLRNEKSLQGPGALRKRDKKRAAAVEEEEPEESESDNEPEGFGPTWPGLESLLPLHTTADFAHFL